MRKKIVAANWKMHGSVASITTLLQELFIFIEEGLRTHCLLLPPSIFIPLVNNFLHDSSLGLGAQNLYPQDKGAFTGELSAPMLKEYGCLYVLVGHSERRQLFTEDENFIANKFHHAKEHGMIPILCIGETLEEQEQGLTKQVLERQLSAVTKDNTNVFSNCIIAYEPIWAIGTGRTPQPLQVQNTHAFIRAFVSKFDRHVAEKLSIIYGGSLNETNATALFTLPDVDGGLVGGASLNARQFADIVKCIKLSW